MHHLPSTLTNYESDLVGYSSAIGRPSETYPAQDANHFYPHYNSQFIPTTIPNRSWLYENSENINEQYGQF